MALDNILNLSDFLGVINDISRPYLFLVSIPFIDSDDVVTCFARSTTLPEYKINSVEVAFQTQKLQIASTAEFSHEWEVEFLVDSGHSIRNKFIGWMALAYDPSIQRNGAPVEYKTDNVQIQQLDRTANTVVAYGFVGLYPDTVGQITLSHEEDKPETFPVNFRYDYWTMGGAGGVNLDIGSFFIGIDLSTGFTGGSLTVGGGIGGIAGSLGISF
jgi:hypothetical protein